MVERARERSSVGALGFMRYSRVKQAENAWREEKESLYRGLGAVGVRTLSSSLGGSPVVAVA